jgi:hypothetical protein
VALPPVRGDLDNEQYDAFESRSRLVVKSLVTQFFVDAIPKWPLFIPTNGDQVG